ncbi:response regulator [Leptolyngbya sp. FACHB-261]|uniref:response regulator n=1 Tax=Leptolyngbya sp. FACHB-261 TaxID=2692806 RepID=UPI0016831704|nr:response regulator [Leptolyngbya sp. FACHB-261]MBD2104434.1 response regulator [Leptolyngbya sp. FACHB-261]
MRFLVVDDSAPDRHLITSLLEELGHQVDTCTSTEGALDKIERGGYAAVFLDIVLPDQDGYKFLRTVRSNQLTAQQYVILYSSKKTPLEISYGLKRAGADNYLTKPVTRENLSQALQRV